MENKEEKVEINNSEEIQFNQDQKSEILKEESITVKKNEVDDEIIDFSEIKEKTKKIFKNLTNKFNSNKDEKNQDIINHEKDNEDISFDFKKITTFCKSNSKWLIPLLFILIAMFTSTHFRMMPSELPITDSWAENTVNNFYKQQITQAINQQYPNLPQTNKDILINKELQKALTENKEQVKIDIAQLSQQYKSNFQDEKGDTYLLAIDPYLWFSEARNVINHGHLGDKIIDGESYFSLRDGRLDKKTSVQLHPYIGAYLYKFLHLFNKDISLMRAIFLLPVIIIGLSIIPIFFIGKRIGGNVGGFFAAMFLALNGPLLSRTPAGFSDTDPYNILFPLMITWLFLEAYMTKNKNHSLLLSIGAGLFSGFYAATWSGWTHIFWFVNITIIISILISFIIDSLKHKKIKFNYFKKESFKKKILLFLSYFISSGIFVSSFVTFNVFIDSFSRIVKFTSLKEVGIKNIWPNVLTTVAEFNTMSVNNLINQIGGNLIFWLGLSGLILLLTKKYNEKREIYYLMFGLVYYLLIILFKEKLNDPIIFITAISIPMIIGFLIKIYQKKDQDLTLPIIITIWLIGSIYAFTKGTRFSLLIAVPFSLALGSSLGFIYQKFSLWIEKGINLNKNISKSIIFLIITLLLISPLSTAEKISKNEVPSMNDAWHTALTKINGDSEQAIITSWWDFGHWFVAISKRMVTFDGGDQGERIHWVGKTLLSNDEQQTIGILKMLNCAQETAPHKLDEFTNDKLKSIRILYEIFNINNRKEAYEKYQDLGLTKEQAKIMLDYTHCEDLIPNYYITSQDMVGKSGVWGHFGSWDFEKATIYQNIKNIPKDKAIKYLIKNFNLTEEKSDNTYYEVQNQKGDQWIAPWPGYLSGLKKCENKDQEIICSASVQQGNLIFRIDPNNFNVTIDNNKGIKPNSIVYATKEGIKEKKFNTNQKVGFSLILFPTKESYNIILADPLIAASTFTKLFFFEGHGSKCFNKFDDRIDPTNQKIITWKVDYTCKQENKILFQNNQEKNNNNSKKVENNENITK